MNTWGRSLSVGASKVRGHFHSWLRSRGWILGWFRWTKVYLSLTGLDLAVLGLRLRQLCSVGGGKDHPLTKLCEVRGHSGYHRDPHHHHWLVGPVAFWVTDLIWAGGRSCPEPSGPPQRHSSSWGPGAPCSVGLYTETLRSGGVSSSIHRSIQSLILWSISVRSGSGRLTSRSSMSFSSDRLNTSTFPLNFTPPLDVPAGNSQHRAPQKKKLHLCDGR